ncbi:MAG: septum formation family protein [Actinomycetaceae bacterium]
MTRIESGGALVVGLLMVAVLLLGIGTGAVGSRIDVDDMIRSVTSDADGTAPHDDGTVGEVPPGGPSIPGAPGSPSAPGSPGTPGDVPNGGPDPEVFDHGHGAPGIFTAAPGDCLVETDATVSVPCDHPHSAEVFYTFTVEGDEYPGDDGFETDLCLEMFGAYVGTTPEAGGYGLTWLVPSRSTWADAGDREVICLLTTEELATGSAYRSAELVV